MRAKLLRISGEALIDLLHGRLWVRNLPADATVARIGVDPLTDCLALTVVSAEFPEHAPYNPLEVLTPEIVNPSPLVSRDLAGNVLAVGLTRWIDPASPDALVAVQALDVTVIVQPAPVSLPPVLATPTPVEPGTLPPVDGTVIA